MKKAILIICMIAIPVAVIAGESILNTKAPDFLLRDQYDREYSLTLLIGKPLVLIASDKEGSKQNREWGVRIQEKYGDRVRIQGVADVRAAPAFFRSVVVDDFKKNKERILLDWDGKVFTTYGLAKRVCNVVLIDANGYVRSVQAGSASTEGVAQLFSTIDGLMRTK